MEIADFSKIFDNIHFSKDGNPEWFEVFCLYSLWWKSLDFTAKKITSNKSFVQFYYAHTEI